MSSTETEKISKLSPEQKAKFGDYVKKWTEIGLSTEPANRPQAEEGIRLAYDIGGLAAPKIVWCNSPLAQALTRAILQYPNKETLRLAIAEGVGAGVWASIRKSIEECIEQTIGENVLNEVRLQVWAGVEARVKNRVWKRVRNEVEESICYPVQNSVMVGVQQCIMFGVLDRVGNNKLLRGIEVRLAARVRESVRASITQSGYGQHDAGLLGYYDYFAGEGGLTLETRALEGLWHITKAAGWFLPHQNVCFVCERPNLLHLDERGWLHSEDGLACSYPDGWGVYAWHGVTVPEWIISQPEKITLKTINKEPKAEIRWVMTERLGNRN